MNAVVQIKMLKFTEAALVVDPFYEQEGKNHRAGRSDLFFVAFIDSKVVGVCRFCIEENTPMLRSMIVHGPMRSQKIGAKILKSFARYLDENNFRSIYCIPYAHLGNFYGSIGFKIIQEKEAPVFLQERLQNYRNTYPEKFMLMRRD